MASCCWVATGGSTSTGVDRKRVIGELTRGREVADQLRQMLRGSGVDDATTSSVLLPAQEDLIGKILESFTHSLSILSAGGGDADEISQFPASGLSSPSLKSEDSGDSCKTPAPKDRRGCYKRRRTSETWTKETAALFEDGHAWRKYGQKVILNATHPRNYFRCTHKFDQGCQASKQVQKIQDDPPLFRTTYHGQHSCKDFLKPSPHHIIVDAAAHDSSSVIWSFGSSRRDHHHHQPTEYNSNMINSDSAIKQEAKEEGHYNPVLKSPSSSSSSLPLPPPPPCDQDYFISHDDLVFGHDSGDWGAFSPGRSDHGDVISSTDVYSCTTSTHSMEMDDMNMMVASVFDELVQLESLR